MQNMKRLAIILVLVVLIAVLVVALLIHNNTFIPSAAEPVAADYSSEANWAYYGLGEDRAADLFLICPTVDMNDEYNMSLEDEETKASFLGALNMERGIYEDSCRMYAPYYRQAAMAVYNLDPEEQEPYMEIAYSDISAAFSWYLTHENNGRPIILAGFSQGADMCYRLLAEYFGDGALFARLVAVYAIGWPCTEDLVQAYPQIVPAESSDDIGVVVSFDCEAPEVEETFINPAGQTAYCINPLNWRTDGTAADKSENLGACFTNYSGEIKSETPGLCGCYIDEARGVVKVTDLSPAEYPPIVPGLPEGAYHVYDYQFFFRNLQQNVRDRLNSFTSSLSAVGNYTDEMKFDDSTDLSDEDGADSVEREGDHAGSPYFNNLDFYNMDSTDTLTILPHFKTIQQSSEWSCGVASALMVLEWYGLRGDFTEESLAELRPQGLEPGATSLSEMVAMFDGVGGFTCYSAIDAGEDVYEIFTFDYILQTLAAGDPIMIGWNDWGGHWQVIIGYDTMGTPTSQDDVIIVADPYDTTDHNQDGYGVYGAERFLYNFTFYNFFEGDELNDMCFLVAIPE